MPAGFFVTFEGVEGSGKTTQMQALAAYLREQGFPVLTTKEPGGTPLGEGIRKLLVDDTQDPPVARAELFLFLADRAHHVEKLIRPALEQGHIVLCDRYVDSTLAYQGYGRGLDLSWLHQLNQWATQGLMPHLTVLFDVDIHVGLQRRRETLQWNRMDADRLDFHQRIRQGYLELARKEPERWVVLDASAPFEQVQQRLRSIILEYLVALRQGAK